MWKKEWQQVKELTAGVQLICVVITMALIVENPFFLFFL